MGALNLSIGLAIGNGNIASGSAPPPTPAPAFTSQPSVSPSSGQTGSTFTATPGIVSNGSITSRQWLLNGSSISTGTTAVPSAAGTLTYQEFATGAGGSASSAVQSVTVTAPPAPSFTTQPSVSPSTGNTGSTFTATPGTVANGSVASREWKQGSTVVSTTTTATPSVAGSMTYQETATGSGGTTLSNVQTVTVTTPAPTGITYRGANNSTGNSLTPPAHQTGDMLIVYAYRTIDATAITVPAGWTVIQSGAANTNADVVAFKIAASSSEVSGTWTNAEIIEMRCYRGASGIGASSQTTTNTTSPASFTYQALALNNTSGSSWVAASVGIKIATMAAETPPSGMVNRTNQTGTNCELASHDTNGGVSSWAGGAGGASGGNRRRINVYEILAAS